ncbi:MAG: hypothetical protein DWQ06_09205 [Calditrichaeota bacterium]|nr:MAG: hypothetical protein DWQ06_09205 [Calditrichota bacterium]
MNIQIKKAFSLLIVIAIGLQISNVFAGSVEIRTAELRISEKNYVYADSILQIHLAEKPNDPEGLYLLGLVKFGKYIDFSKGYESQGELGKNLKALDEKIKSIDDKTEKRSAMLEKQTLIFDTKLKDDSYWAKHWELLGAAEKSFKAALENKPKKSMSKKIKEEREKIYLESARSGGFFLRNAATSNDGNEQKKFFAEAFKHYSVSKSIDQEKFDKSFGTTYNYAIIAEQTDQKGLAKEYYSKSVENTKKEDDRSKVLSKLALYDIEDEKFDDAVKKLESVFKTNESDVDVINNLAFCYQKLDKKDKADEMKQKLLELDPEGSIGIVQEQGTACLEQEEYDCAIEKFEKVLAKEPDNAPVVNNIGFAFLKRGNDGDDRKAFDAFKKYTELKPDDCQGWANLAIAARDVKETKVQIECAKAMTKLECNKKKAN